MSTQPEMQYLRMAQEASWGAGKDASFDWQGVSVPVGGYNPNPVNEVDTPRKSEGTYQQTRYRRTGMDVTGDFTPQLFPDNAQFILDMALRRDANGNLQSYVAEWCTPGGETRRHTGIMVARARFECRTGGEFVLSFDLVVKDELGADDGVTSFAIPSFPTTVAYYFIDLGGSSAWLKYDGVQKDTMRGFMIEVDNNLDIGPRKTDATTGHPIIQSCRTGAQDVTVELDDEVTGYEYRQDVRDFLDTSLDVKFEHPTAATVRLYLPLLKADQSPDSHDNIVTTQPRLTAYKPSGEDKLQYTVENAS